MTTFDEIIDIANTLADNGQKPTVALVKQKLTSPVPLPILINTLKNWQHQPHKRSKTIQQTLTKTNVADTELSITLEQLNMLIQRQIQPLEAQIAQLKQMINDINQKLK